MVSLVYVAKEYDTVESKCSELVRNPKRQKHFVIRKLDKQHHFKETIYEIFKNAKTSLFLKVNSVFLWSILMPLLHVMGKKSTTSLNDRIDNDRGE